MNEVQKMEQLQQVLGVMQGQGQEGLVDLLSQLQQNGTPGGGNMEDLMRALSSVQAGGGAVPSGGPTTGAGAIPLGGPPTFGRGRGHLPSQLAPGFQQVPGGGWPAAQAGMGVGWQGAQPGYMGGWTTGQQGPYGGGPSAQQDDGFQQGLRDPYHDRERYISPALR